MGDAGRYQDAIDLAEEILRRAEAEGDERLVAQWQNNLGIAYSDLPTGDRGENLKRAIGCYEAALTVYTEEAYPREHEFVTGNLRLAEEALAELAGEGEEGEGLVESRE